MSGLFSESCKRVNTILCMLQPETFEEELTKIKNQIDISYESDDEDIEDLGDIIMLLNEYSEHMIKDLNFTNSHVADMIVMRVYAKKLVKKKFRDVNNRNFWNKDEAFFQYQELVIQWKESVNNLLSLTFEYRPDIIVNEKQDN